MEEKKIAGSKKRKALSATLAVAMVLTMLLSGTLAYFYQSFATNQFDGKQLEKRAIGHDDFNKATGNKDIYVENAGDSPIYVRVKLTEDYCDNEQTTDIANPAGLNYMNGFNEVNVNADGSIKRGEMIHAISDANGSSGDPALGDGTEHQDFHKNYFAWTWGTEGKTYLRAKDETQYGNDETADKYFKDKVAYDTTNNGNKYIFTEDDDTIGRTADSDGVLTYRQWEGLAAVEEGATTTTQITAAKKRYDFTGWILAPDGWCYWSKPVQAGEATGLLLDQVEKKGRIKNDDLEYEYHIHVQFEATNDADVGLWQGSQSTSVDGDSWENSQTADWSGVQIISRLIFENHYDVNALLTEIDQLEADWKSAEGTDKDGNTVSLTSPAALKTLENAKIGILKCLEASVNDIERAKQQQASYAQNKMDAANGVEGAEDPDKIILDREKVTDTAVADYLFNTYGDGNKLTREQADVVQAIYLVGKDGANKMNVSTWSWLSAENFPNLNYFQLTYVSFTGEDSLNLPATVTGIKFDEVSGINKMDISSLKLKSFALNVTSLKKLANSKSEEGVYGLSNSYNTLITCDLRSIDLITFDASVMPNVEDMCFGAYDFTSKMTSLKLDNLEKLVSIYLAPNKVMEKLDISTTGLASLNTRGFKALKQITCREGQKIQNSTGHNVYLKIIDSGDTVSYKKISATGVETSCNADDFTNAEA